MQPGYYSVLLQDSNIFAELTATQYVGVHLYTFAAGTPQPTVLFDVSAQLGDGACINSSVAINASSGGACLQVCGVYVSVRACVWCGVCDVWL